MWMLLLACAGVTVTVENNTDAPLDDVVVEVTGNTYDLGTIAPHGEAAVAVKPTGESSVVVTASRQGRPERVDADAYIESSGYRGTIGVAFQPDGAAEVDSDLRIGLLSW